MLIVENSWGHKSEPTAPLPRGANMKRSHRIALIFHLSIHHMGDSLLCQHFRAIQNDTKIIKNNPKIILKWPQHKPNLL